jgi:TonB family protein
MRALVVAVAIFLASREMLAKELPGSGAPRRLALDSGQSADAEAYTPTLQYPKEARKRNVQGSGTFVMFVQIRSGTVQRVEIERSTGSKILDDAAVSNLRDWLFKPPVLRRLQKRLDPSDNSAEIVIKLPVTFKL